MISRSFRWKDGTASFRVLELRPIMLWIEILLMSAGVSVDEGAG